MEYNNPEEKSAHIYRDSESQNLFEDQSNYLPDPVAHYHASKSNWEDTRVVTLFAGLSGLIGLFMLVPTLADFVQHPVLLNILLLLGIAGFSNIAAFPYFFQKTWGQSTNNMLSPHLQMMRWAIFAFIGILSLILFTIPIKGIAIALILCPAPLYVAIKSGQIMNNKENPEFPRWDILQSLSMDLKKLFWLSIMVFLPMIFFLGLRNFLTFFGW